MALDLLNSLFKSVSFSLYSLCGLHNKHIQFQGVITKAQQNRRKQQMRKIAWFKRKN